ncbi:hypothetical protein FC32_GL001348 [Ligilactobacillus apodemi DSM 16634 = JCM 16172]|uniref:Exonuclease SbcC n=1 Tax=Ligilactobacillus apodemi DSM 16634 = JCM 16172 TaxID=1423724 RepID=A0A0R1TZ16_9LACO|nr:hypothetical protein [Ligilactobacillus apodemi]KRL84072.1 hypothetical protein FC32_GL001348 [Ligilactobacillus apodemi DSM 16634 = JCM 16172]MBD5069321.1 exonuclease SbcC [Lactobacillus sp.]MCR1900949.1 exonuclease SbcC [Ligilactobacillus apodemi]
MANSNQLSLSAHKQATESLTQAILDKTNYLNSLEKAVQDQDDRLVYQLIDGERYAKEILKQSDIDADFSNERLIRDIYPKISDFLSKNLIDYLYEMYPFFYFEETGIGQFQFFFGNWWGRRLFGTLDILNVSFEFDEVEYQKLAKSFALEEENKRLNSDEITKLSQETDELQNLIDQQAERDKRKDELRQEIKRTSQEKVMPWESSKVKESKQRLIEELSELTEIDEKASGAYRQIRENEEKVLALSKEDTLIGYEKQSIIAKFGSFENFEAHNAALYRNYIADLIAKQK